MQERKIVSEVVKFAESRGWVHRKVVYQNRAGAPDDWFFTFPERLIIIEFKRPGEVPKPHQQREIDRLRKLGFKVHVIDNIEAGRALFE